MKTILTLFVLMCPTVTLAVESVLLRDDLKGLQDGWKWIREDRDNWRIRDKALEIRVLPGNMWGRSNNAKNVLVRPVALPKAGTLEVSATVENRPTNQYEQIDLVLYFDDGHMVKIGQELVHGKLSVVMGREEGDRTRTIAIIPLKSHRVGLRYQIKADTIRGFYRPEGAKEWKEAGSCKLPRPKNDARPHISLQAYQGPKDKAHWARITDVKLRLIPDKESAERAPNLLYVFPDQMRLHAMGFWKKPGFKRLLRTETDPVSTPSIDRLAERGLVFTQATSTHPVCSPHRGMLMSGIYSSRNGIENANCRAGRKQGLHHHIECFTDVLAKAGYETAYVGKTHWERTKPLFDKQLNYVGTTEPPGGVYANRYDTYIPPGRGRFGNKFWFQQFVDNHFNALTYSNRPELVSGKKDGQPHRPKRFTPEVEADVVIRFLRNKHGEREAGKPFSIFWAPNPPHAPYSSPEHCEKDIYDKHYRNMAAEQLMYRKNAIANRSSEKPRPDPTKCAPIYYSLVTGVDRQLGRVLRALEETGEAKNTIVVFTSDHGEMLGSHGLMGKNHIEDESFLVPYLISYPEQIKPRADNLLLETVDIMPSILGMMGLRERIPSTAEGVDYSVGMTSGDYSNCPKPKSALYLNAVRKGVRTNRYTYLVHGNGRAEVTDNIADPYQLNRLKPSAIPKEDLHLLKRELGSRLTRAGDQWAKEKKFAGQITYPAQ